VQRRFTFAEKTFYRVDGGRSPGLAVVILIRRWQDIGIMSQKRTHEIACPFCGHEQEVELYDSIVVDEEPELRVALLSNRLNRVECEMCRKNFRVDKPLVYHDREQELFIHFDPLIGGRTLEQAEESFATAMSALRDLLPEGVEPPETHLVVEWTELIELVFLLEEGLDPRLVEHIKYMMFQQNPDRLDARAKGLLFDAQDSTDEQLCFVVQDRKTRKLEAVLNFSRADYEALVNVFDSGDQLALLKEQFPGPYLNGRLKYLQDQVMADDEAADAGVFSEVPPPL
jgi:hypothetical protein